MTKLVRHNPLTTQMFLDINGSVEVQRFDVVRYPIFLKLSKQQTGVFWQADEVDCKKDGNDFKTLTTFEKHIFTSNIKRQIVLDSKQGRAPATILAPIASSPELEKWIMTWTYFETIHSEAYTHIIQQVYPDPTAIIDSIYDIKEILECNDEISRYYDVLDYHNTLLKTNSPIYSRYEHKKALWLCLNNINALEAVRFYVSFACSWAFAELKKMVGNATIIKMIARDENIHHGGTQQMLKLLPRDDVEFANIQIDTRDEVTSMFIDIVNQEKAWARYLFKDGSMIGLNAPILEEHVEGMADGCMRRLGLVSPYGGSRQIPWTKNWISGKDNQAANQETEGTMYSLDINRSYNQNRFTGFQL